MSKTTTVSISLHQMEQMMGKEIVLQQEMSDTELEEFIRSLPALTRYSIGNKNMNIITKIISGQSTLYDWYDNKIAGL